MKHPSYLLETKYGTVEITPHSGQEVYLFTAEDLMMERMKWERNAPEMHTFRLTPGTIQAYLTPNGWEMQSFRQYRYVNEADGEHQTTRPPGTRGLVPDKVAAWAEVAIIESVTAWVKQNPALILRAEHVSERLRLNALQEAEFKLRSSLKANLAAQKASETRIEAQRNALLLLSISGRG